MDIAIRGSTVIYIFRKNLNAFKPSEHPPSGEKLSKYLGENIIGCRDTQTLHGIKRVPLHKSAVTQYSVPLHNLHEGTPKQRQKSTLNIELGFGSDYRMTSYNRALGITRYKSIETTLRTRRLFFVGGSAHTNERRAAAKANRVRKNLEGAERRGRGGKEKEWTDCVQSDIRAFGISGEIGKRRR